MPQLWLGAINRSGSNLASYLLFEPGFCNALIDLGYEDTLERMDEVCGFLIATESPRDEIAA